jgi:hypothetical protein
MEVMIFLKHSNFYLENIKAKKAFDTVQLISA